MSNGFDLTKNINVRDPELLDAFRQILTRREQGSLTRKGALSKSKELIGERQALDRISRRFPGAEPIVIARRANGVPILDLVLRTQDDRFVIIEAKFSSAGRINLGHTNSRMWVHTQNGWKRIKVKGATTQMSPRWIEDRIIELENSGQRRIAGQLKQALQTKRFNAYIVVTDSTGDVLKVIDNTPELTRSFTRRGVEFRPTSPTLEPSPTRSAPVGNRAVDNRWTGATATEEVETLASRRSTSIVAREGGEVAVRQAAVRGAARTVGRVLVAVIGRLIVVLNVVDLTLLAVEIVGFIWDHFKEKAINNAIEKALRTNIPLEINTALDQNRDEIARYFARAWLNEGIKRSVFLYLSPRLVVTGGYTRDGFSFDVSLTVKSFANDLVSTQFLSPERKDLGSSGLSFNYFQFRWSIDQPIYTPFDIYRAFTEFFVEHVVDSWAMHYANGVKLSPATVMLFHTTVDILAHMSATLKNEPWFGYNTELRRFPSSMVGSERWEALQELSRKIEKELIPNVSALESRRLINTGTVRWDAYWSPMRSELDPRGEESLLPSMRRIAKDMKFLDANYLDYEHFETMHARVKGRQEFFAWVPGNSVEAQKFIDLREFLKPVQHHLPKSLIPTPYILELPAETAAS